MTASAFNRTHLSSNSIATEVGDSIILIYGNRSSLSLNDAIAISHAEKRPLQEACSFLFKTPCSSDVSVRLTPLSAIRPNFIVSSAVPVWKGGGWDEDIFLANSLKECLQRSIQEVCKDILISTESLETCGFPSNRHVRIAIGQAHQFLTANKEASVKFVGDGTQSAYHRECSRQQRLLEDSDAMQRVQMTPFSVECTAGSIVNMRTDAIVNAANNVLRGGEGVDGAIHRAAGPRLSQACRNIGGCATGDAVVTDGYGLDASYIIHTVGPIWSGGRLEEDELLASCYMSSLEKAVGLGCRSVAFPAISCGVYGFPQVRAMKIAIRSVEKFKLLTWSDIKVYFSCYESIMTSLYRDELRSVWNEGNG